MATRLCGLIVGTMLFAILVPKSPAAEIAVAPPASAKPDILLLMPDQMRGDCLSIVGHPVVRTPTLDKLATQGALFRRAYSTCPSCIPARYALLTGLFPQTSGVVGFQQKRLTSPTMPQLLHDAGYTSVLVGRNMHQSADAKALGYDRDILGSTYVAGDAYDTELLKAAPDTGGITKLIDKLGITTNGWQANAWPLADDLHPTAWVANRSRQIIAETPPAQPLFLTASFYSPHSPLFPPRKFFDDCLKRTLPPAAHGDWVDWNSLKPPQGPRDISHRVLLEGDTLRAAQAGYFGLIEHLDEQIAPLVAAFQARSAAAGRPWVIIFTSDHGELLGDHGYYRKCEPFEGSANIPFIITASPGLNFRPALRSSQPVCLEDILPTMLDLAGAKPPPMDGLTLAPVLRGDTTTIRPWLHCEHSPCYGPDQAFHSLTDGHLKYIWRPKDGRELLFDLDNDPHEEHDLSTDPAHRQQLETWRTCLIKRLAIRPEGFSDGHRLIPGRPYPAIQKKSDRP